MLGYVILERIHLFLGTCQIALGRGNLACSLALLLRCISLSLENFLSGLFETSECSLVLLFLLCQFPSQEATLAILLLDGSEGILQFVLELSFRLGGGVGLFGQFGELLVEFSFLVVSYVGRLFGVRELNATFFEGSAKLLSGLHRIVQLSHKLSMQTPTIIRPKRLKLHLQLVQLLKLFPFLLQLARVLDGSPDIFAGTFLRTLLFQYVVPNARINSIQPFQLGGLGEKFVLVLRLSRQKLLRLLLIQHGDGIFHLDIQLVQHGVQILLRPGLFFASVIQQFVTVESP
mmetsp:Transcript_14515/g.34990  ORF Transcript_14515/g.34990 Transcript_14515/m.34990 type:complete len:289 (+) Transcript_14515:543-1409(+)